MFAQSSMAPWGPALACLVARLDAKLDAAQADGGLQSCNREFRRRRIEATARRLPFPTYNTALAKLRAALAGSIGGTTICAVCSRRRRDKRASRFRTGTDRSAL